MHMRNQEFFICILVNLCENIQCGNSLKTHPSSTKLSILKIEVLNNFHFLKHNKLSTFILIITNLNI